MDGAVKYFLEQVPKIEYPQRMQRGNKSIVGQNLRQNFKKVLSVSIA